MYKFAKYRHKTSAGPGMWEYEVFPDWFTLEDLKEHVSYNLECWTHSEHYRGFEYDFCDFHDVPEKERLRIIKNLRDTQKSVAAQLEWFEKEICYESRKN